MNAAWSASEVSGAYAKRRGGADVVDEAPALSDPAGQFIAEGRLQRVKVLEHSQPDAQTALVTVAVDADNPSGETLSIVYDIELWRSDDGHWLVAFADLTAG